MLQSFRERMQGIVAWTIVIAICITFALWGIQNYLHGDSSGDSIAKVNGIRITQKKLMMAYEVLRKTKMNQLGADFQNDQASQYALKKQALDNLIKEEVLLQATQKMGLFVSNNEVTGFINSLPQFQQKGIFSRNKFYQFISMAYNGNQSEFVSEVNQALIFTQLEAGIRVSEFVLPNEISFANKLKKQTRDLGYILVIADNFQKDMKLKDTEIEDYYNKNKNKFATEEQASIEYVQLSADDLKSQVNVAGKKLEGQAKSDYIKQQTMQLFNDQYDKLSDLTYTNSDNLTQAATSLGLVIKTTVLFTEKGQKAGLLSNKKVIKAAFSESVLRQGYNSSPIEITPGNVIVLRIKKHIPKDTMPLAKVLPEIQKTLTEQKTAELAKATGEELVAQLKQKQDVKALLGKNHLQLKTFINVGRQNSQIDTQILKGAFDLPNPDSGIVSVKGISLTNGDYAVIIVNKVHEGKDVNKSLDKDVRQALQSEFGAFDYSLFIHELMSKAKIKIESMEKSDDSISGDSTDSDQEDN